MSNAPTTAKLRIPCPECQKRAYVRTSKSVSDVTRMGVLECADIEGCGWRGNFSVQITDTIVPSLNPRPDLHLPPSPRAVQR